MKKRYKSQRISRVVDNKIVLKMNSSLILRQREVIEKGQLFFQMNFKFMLFAD